MKTYIKPELFIKDIQVMQMLALSTFEDEADANGEVLTKGRRGVWGNLWEEAEEEE